MQTVAVIDYGMGNLHSVAKALEHEADADTRVVLTADPRVIRSAHRVVLPGVGAMGDCMAEIRRLGLDSLVADLVAEQAQPILGICVGMQVLFEHSAESDGVAGLGLLPGHVAWFGGLPNLKEIGLKVPHMGWNQVYQQQASPLWEGIEQGERFYFVHSYFVECSDPQIVTGTSAYGRDFDVTVVRGNLAAVQFHPEKSAQPGLRLLRNFLQ